MNGIGHCVALCVLLLSVSVMFSRFLSLVGLTLEDASESTGDLVQCSVPDSSPETSVSVGLSWEPRIYLFEKFSGGSGAAWGHTLRTPPPTLGQGSHSAHARVEAQKGKAVSHG